MRIRYSYWRGEGAKREFYICIQSDSEKERDYLAAHATAAGRKMKGHPRIETDFEGRTYAVKFTYRASAITSNYKKLEAIKLGAKILSEFKKNLPRFGRN